MKNNTLLFICAILLGISLAINYGFYKYAGTHEVTTDSILTTDTLWLERRVVDSIPKIKYTTLIKCDTIYQKQGDTLIANALFVKKKLIRTR